MFACHGTEIRTANGVDPAKIIELKEMTAICGKTATSDVLGKVFGANLPLDVHCMMNTGMVELMIK